MHIGRVVRVWEKYVIMKAENAVFIWILNITSIDLFEVN